MKVGDKIKYKGGKNDFWISCDAFEVDEIYKISYVDKYQVMVNGEDGKYISSTLKELSKFFEVIDVEKDQHYDNTNGSLYLFANQHELNAWEFDCIKRLVRCRKKGQFREDLEKTIRVIELYLKEMEL
jgi:hypothetical protein